MNKCSLKGFSLGMIFTVGMIGTYYYFFDQPDQKSFNDVTAKKQLEKLGYTVLTANEYKKLIMTRAASEKSQPQK